MKFVLRSLVFLAALGMVAAAAITYRDSTARFRPIDEGPINAGEDKGIVTVPLIFGGNFQGFVEPCGCSKFQLGGLVNLGAFLDDLRAQDKNSITFLMPTLMGGEGALERLKNKAVLKAAEVMNPDVLVLGSNDLAFPEPLVHQLLNLKVPILASNVRAPGAEIRYKIEKKVGDLPVVIVGVPDSPGDLAVRSMGLEVENPFTALERVIAPYRNKPALIVLLSGMTAAATSRVARHFPEIDLVVSTDASQEVRDRPVETTMFFAFHNTNRSQGISILDIGVNAEGEIKRFPKRTVEVQVGRKHEALAAEVKRFYDEVAVTPELIKDIPPKCEKCELENRPGYTYVGAEACKACHPVEYNDWLGTKHSLAYITLANAQRQYSPECLACHVVGLGRKGGFNFSDGPASPLKSVQCEVCHGPGSQHMLDRAKASTRRETPLSLCRECHTPERHPGFAAHEAEHLAHIDHKAAKSRVASLDKLANEIVDPYEEKLALGKAFLKSGNKHEAAEALLAAYKLKPDQPEPLVLGGFALTHYSMPLRRQAEGRKLLKEAVDKFPSYMPGHFRYGYTTIQKGDLEEGFSHMQIAEKAGYDDPEFYFYLGLSYGFTSNGERGPMVTAVDYMKKSKAAGFNPPRDEYAEWSGLIDPWETWLKNSEQWSKLRKEPIKPPPLVGKKQP